MHDLVTVLLAILATYRIARMMAYEEGPYGIFTALRLWAGGMDLGPDGQPDTALGRLVTCPLCIGVYVAAIHAVMVMWPTTWGNLWLIWLGIAGGQTYLQRTE